MEARVPPPDDQHRDGGEAERFRYLSKRDELISPLVPLSRVPIGVFDPPEDPEPPGEHSVWGRPMGELTRRDTPGLNRSDTGERLERWPAWVRKALRRRRVLSGRARQPPSAPTS
jgi:hypothetical protein